MTLEAQSDWNDVEGSLRLSGEKPTAKFVGLDMRSTRLALVAISLALSASAPSQTVASPKSAALVTTTINVLDSRYGFGIKANDSSYDNFLPLQRAASYLCAHGGNDANHLTRLLFPPGIYHIATTVGPIIASYANLKTYSVPFENCNNVDIYGKGAKIDVTGAFTKNIYSQITTTYFVADRFAVVPFYLLNGSNITLEGFEITGNVNQMLQDVPPGAILVEGVEYGVFVDHISNYTLRSLYIHHMATDGIEISASKYGEIVNTTVTNNTRNNISLAAGVQNLLVHASSLNYAGVNNSNPVNGYPAHSPITAFDIDPECVLDGMTPINGWATCVDPYGNKLGPVGNILLDHVTLIGNGNGVQAFEPNTANVTIQYSKLISGRQTYQHNSPPGQFLLLAIPGGVIKNSTIDVGYDNIAPCGAGGLLMPVSDMNSTALTTYLGLLADDPWVHTIAPPGSPTGMYAETYGAPSTAIQGNKISGPRNLLYCWAPMKTLTVISNQFHGSQSSQIAGDIYWTAASYLYVSMTKPNLSQQDPPYTPSATVSSNNFYIPSTAPVAFTDPGYPSVGNAVMAFNDVTYFGSNVYKTDASAPPNTFGIYYELDPGVLSAAHYDAFPANGSIIPLRGPYDVTNPWKPWVLIQSNPKLLLYPSSANSL